MNGWEGFGVKKCTYVLFRIYFNLFLMLHPRIIPVLLIHKGGLIKTVQFKNPKYVGDPINAVKIFNEKEADEIMVIDIDATTTNREPNYGLIEKIAVECRMPLCYGGGIKSLGQAKKILALGVEKISISSAAIFNNNLLSEIANEAGSQSVVCVLDVKKSFLGGYQIYINNGKKKVGIDLISFLKNQLSALKCGELVINSIDNDGTMKGYDLDLIEKVKNLLSIPLTVVGGAGKMEDLGTLMNKFGAIGIGAGSLFVFKGKYRAVLINYPSMEEKERLISQYFSS